jgi:hypothetical protein
VHERLDQAKLLTVTRRELAYPPAEVGVYVLVAPEPDHQDAHTDDELYVVLEGRGELTIEGDTVCSPRGAKPLSFLRAPTIGSPAMRV